MRKCFGLICTNSALLACYSTDYLFFLNLAVILVICKLEREDVNFQLANIGFWIQHTQVS